MILFGMLQILICQHLTLRCIQPIKVDLDKLGSILPVALVQFSHICEDLAQIYR